MSTFDGFIEELPFLSIDRFEQPNLKSSAFLLSHCHADHMVGLDSDALSEMLQERGDVFIYCSEISKLWLCEGDSKYQHLEKYIVSLPINQSEEIKICNEDGEKNNVKVTLISAGHCPGSVMFLLENEDTSVIYTGDFRWKIGQAAQVEQFKEGSRVKKFQSLYIDTTFCDVKAYCIPDREQCVKALISAIEPHITSGQSNMVRLECKAQLGYEYLFLELHKHFKMKIHVSEWQWEKYRHIPDLSWCVTPHPEDTQIHACKPVVKKGMRTGTGPYLRCGYRGPGDTNLSVMVVQTSTMWWSMFGVPMKEICIRPEPASKPWFYRACYSTHSSYTEIRDVVEYLRPSAVHANVIPQNTTLDEITARLQSFLSNNDEDVDTKKAESSPEYKPLGVVRVSRGSRDDGVCSSGGKSSKETSLYYGSLDVEPVKVGGTREECESREPAAAAASSSCSESFLSDSQLTYMSDGSCDSWDDHWINNTSTTEPDQQLELDNEQDIQHLNSDKTDPNNVHGNKQDMDMSSEQHFNSEQDKQDLNSVWDKEDQNSEQHKQDLNNEHDRQDFNSKEGKQDLNSVQDKQDPNSKQDKQDLSSEEDKKDMNSEQEKDDFNSKEDKQDVNSVQDKQDPNGEEDKQGLSGEEDRQDQNSECVENDVSKDANNTREDHEMNSDNAEDDRDRDEPLSVSGESVEAEDGEYDSYSDDDDGGDIIFVEEKPLREVPACALRGANVSDIPAYAAQGSPNVNMDRNAARDDREVSEDSSGSEGEVECIDLTLDDEESSNCSSNTKNKRVAEVESPNGESPVAEEKRRRVDVGCDDVVLLDDDDGTAGPQGSSDINSRSNKTYEQVILPPIFTADHQQHSPTNSQNPTTGGSTQESQASDSSIEVTPTKVIPFSI